MKRQSIPVYVVLRRSKKVEGSKKETRQKGGKKERKPGGLAGVIGAR